MAKTQVEVATPAGVAAAQAEAAMAEAVVARAVEAVRVVAARAMVAPPRLALVPVVAGQATTDHGEPWECSRQHAIDAHRFPVGVPIRTGNSRS